MLQKSVLRLRTGQPLLHQDIMPDVGTSQLLLQDAQVKHINSSMDAAREHARSGQNAV